MSDEPRKAKDLNKPKEWADVNRNKLNKGKCKTFIFLKSQMQKDKTVWDWDYKWFGKESQEF